MLGKDWTSIDHASFGRVMNLKENTGLLNGILSVDPKTKEGLVLRILKLRTNAFLVSGCGSSLPGLKPCGRRSFAASTSRLEHCPR